MADAPEQPQTPPSMLATEKLLLCHDFGTDPSGTELDAVLSAIDVNGSYMLFGASWRLLLKLAWSGNVPAVACLLRHKADPNLTGGPYIADGAALRYAIESTDASAAQKTEIVRLLLAAGADPNRGAIAGETLLDHLSRRAANAARPRENFDTDTRRSYARMLRGYLAVVSLLAAAGGTMGEPARKRLLALSRQPKRTGRFEPSKVRALIARADRASMHTACAKLLAMPGAAAHPEWAVLVRAAIDAGRSFSSVAAEVYGKAMTMAEDEGWLCQSWEDYIILDLVFALLSGPESVGHPQWRELTAHALAQRRAQDAVAHTQESVDELFATDCVRAHPACGHLLALANGRG
jgi:hypothetical protein